ncbi:hypothetical protein KGY73_08915 [bacterium]|nr:hypothetical protein [bacterium]
MRIFNSRSKIFVIAVGTLFFFFSTVPFMRAAEETSLEKVLSEIFPVSSPTGKEGAMTQKIRALLPEGYSPQRDNLGSLFLTRGEGEKHLAVVTGMDELSFIVSGITEEGYLRLDRVVPRPHSLWDAFLFGHAVKVWTQSASLSGVVAIPSVHIASREMRRAYSQSFGLEKAYLDIGASSREEARERGVHILDPVTLWPDRTHLAGSQEAGVSLGLKTCVAVLLQGAKSTSSQGLGQKTSFIWLAQSQFPARGARPTASVGAVKVQKNFGAEKYFVVDVFPCEKGKEKGISIGKGPVLIPGVKRETELSSRIERTAREEGVSLQRAKEFSSPVLNAFLKPEQEAVGLFLPVQFSATPSEVVDFKDAEALLKIVQSFVQERGRQ